MEETLIIDCLRIFFILGIFVGVSILIIFDNICSYFDLKKSLKEFENKSDNISE